jgi:YYY domain-containing protein
VSAVDQIVRMRRRARPWLDRRRASLWLVAGLLLAGLGQQILNGQQNTPLALALYGMGLGLLVLLARAAEQGPIQRMTEATTPVVDIPAGDMASRPPPSAELLDEPPPPARPEEVQSEPAVPPEPPAPYARYIRPALAAILIVAAILRFIGLDWDAGQHLHPDERFITMVETSIKLPSGVGEYFDTGRSSLNPYNNGAGSFIYGTFPLFFVRTSAEAIQTAARAINVPQGTPVAELLAHFKDMAGYSNVNLFGRALSGLADLVTIFLIFLIGRRLYSPLVGLVAALLAALTVLQIQAAHFFTAESPLTLFVTIAFYFAVRVAQRGATLDWALLGISIGLAVATKINALMLGALVLSAGWVLWYRGTRESAVNRRRLVEDVLTGFALTGALVFITFRVAQPYAFAGPNLWDIAPNPKYLSDLETWQRFASGEADIPPNHQWTGATPYVWQLKQMFLWAMGPPLALASWAGFLLAAILLVRNPGRHYLQVLPAVWVGLNFLYWGVQFGKPMRYLLPIYPELALLAGWLLVVVWGWARSGEWPTWARWRPSDRLLRAGATALVVAVVGWSAFYAVAFASIYTRATTRVAASDWIFANVPAGAAVGFEHWDDGLPLRVGGKDSAIYKGVEFPMYAEDNPDKRNLVVQRLDQADYIFISSNRLYGSIPKLPMRYPMTTRYYQALFAGELGFDNVIEFTSRPSLFGIELNDDDAEEIFTVYEHPKVTIFKKSARYSSAEVRRILEGVSLDNVVRTIPIHARTNGLLLDAGSWAADRAGGTWSAMFDRGSIANGAPILVWYLAVQLLAVLALPLTWLVFRRVADGGYAFAKTIGLIVVSYVPWLLASAHIVPYSRIGIGISVLMLGGASAYVFWRFRPWVLADLRTLRRSIIATEVIFLVAFIGFLGLRLANPDLWHPAYGGEKPMDFAYLNAVIKTTWFPPYDPWFAGGYINYYYFGQVVIASLTKLTGIVPWVAYNLAIPTIAALAAINVVSVVYNLLLRRRGSIRREFWALGGGVAAALMAVVLGNLHGAVQLFDYLGKLDKAPIQSAIPGLAGAVSALRGTFAWATSFGQGLPAFNFDFWGPTRVITTEGVAPITEFPYFTFLYGDLHAHMIDMPFGLLVVGLAVNLLRQPAWFPRIRDRQPRDVARDLVAASLSPAGLTILLAALTIGILRMTNSWDYPTYLGLFVAAFALSEALRRARDWTAVAVRTVVLAGVVVVVGQVLITPYLNHYELFYGGFEISKARTTAPHYLIIMGSFLGVLAVYLAFQISALRQRLADAGLAALAVTTGLTQAQGITAAPPMQLAPTLDRFAVGFAAAAVFVSILLLLAGAPVVGIAALGIATLILVAALRRPAPATLFVFLLAGTALALTAGVELITLKGDIGRMNTVFKFYLPAWLFLAIASGALLAVLARRLWGSPWLNGGGRRVTAVAVGILIAATLIYPLKGTPAKLQHRFLPLPPSVDGMEYMAQARYEDNSKDLQLPDDFEAINWMLDNIQGSPVIVEGLAPLYHWRSRVSIYTGLPAVLGWDWHQKQQRGDFAYMIDDRVRDVDQIFKTTSPNEARQLMDKYEVEYVYVGGQERAFYPPEGIDKFERMVRQGAFERVHQHGAVSIYHVVR